MLASGTRLAALGSIWLALTGLVQADAIPLAAKEGHCECILATPHESDQFYLIVGTPAETSRSTRISVRTQAAAGPAFLPLDQSAQHPAWKTRIEAQARDLERQRRSRPSQDRFPPLVAPPPTKIFHLFTGERDLENSAHYQAVHAELYAIGRLAQVYLDRDDQNVPGIDGTIAEVLRIFDQDIGPRAERELGRVLDVDRDGRFTIFFTRKLGALQNGKIQVDGFVRGSDFFRDLPSPFSNHCDMLYLNARLKPGPHLRTVMAHEFTHAVTFCEHALTAYHERPTNQDEESWLGEGLSHLVENPRAFGWSNLDYRISAYLAKPEQFPLVVPDYFAAGLWRNPGTRGAAFLFLRSCQAHADGDMTRRLIQSPLRGIANLEAATQKPFAELFRQAAVDCLGDQNYGYLDKDEPSPLLCGPRFQDLPLDGGHADTTMAGTAAAFFLLHSPAGAHARLIVEAGGAVQVTLVPVPPGVPRLSLRWLRAAERLRVELTAHHGTVWLRGAEWDQAPAKSQQPSQPASWFDRERLEPGTSVISATLAVPPSREISEGFFKVWGQDAQGRPIAAWINTKEE